MATDTETITLPPKNVPASDVTARVPTRGPQSFAAKHGLPPLAGSQLKFGDFITWWRKVKPEQRKQMSIYVYPLFPALEFPDREHSIAILPGEKPLGGETGPPEESAVQAALNMWGLGDFYFQLQFVTETQRIMLVKAWLKGYSDNLPGYRDFTNHPPLFVRDPKYVKLDDDKNIKSGFIQWMKKTGQLPGEAGVKETQESMAEVKATETLAASMGQIMGKVVDRAFEDKDAPAPAPVAQPDQGVAMIREALSTVHEINKQNAVNLPELLRTAAEVTRHEPAPVVPPPDFTPFTDQVSKLTDAVIGMHAKRGDDLAQQLQQQNALMQRLLERERAPAMPIERTDPMDSLIATADKFGRLKEALGFTPPVPDDDPPRRRRRPDADDEDEDGAKKSNGILDSILNNLPTILSAMTTIGTLVVTGMHNAQVMKTGIGETAAPPPAPGTGLLPFQAPPFMPNPQPSANPQLQSQPAPLQQENPQMKALNFLQQLAPGLLGAFERVETGYEYAETFIKSCGRTGEFGYEALKMAGSAPPFGDPAQGFNPLGSAKVLAQLLSMYPPIWGKVGNDPRLTDFLMQFVSYDEFLRDVDVPNLMRLCIEFEVDSVAEYLALPEDDDVEGQSSGEEDGAQGADVHASNAIPMPPVGTSASTTDGAKPEVVSPPARLPRKPRPTAASKPVN